jgi:predicted phosphoribosyltransferase
VSGTESGHAALARSPPRVDDDGSWIPEGPVHLPFNDRVEAGRELAARLARLRGPDVVVLGLPRGGVPVAAEVARALEAPLDIIVVRKLGLPEQPELAMGAVGEGGVRILDEDLVRAVGVTRDELDAVEARERRELDRRASAYRGGLAPIPVAGRVAVVVDDGIATGATARVACRIARAHGARRVVFGAPVGPSSTVRRLGEVADEVVCPATPGAFFAIGQFYRDFRPTTDAEVTAILAAARARQSGAARQSGVARKVGARERVA